MVKRLIKKIRRQSRETRDKVALGAAVAVTAVVFMVWAYHMPARHTTLAEQSAPDDSPGFFSVFSSAKEQVAEVRESLSSVTNATTETAPQSVDTDTDDVTHTTSTNDAVSLQHMVDAQATTSDERATTSTRTYATATTTETQRVARIVTTQTSSTPATTTQQ